LDPVASNKEKAPVTIAYCELLQSPEKYEQQSVRFKAIYRYGFEWAEFYSLKCATPKSVWVKREGARCENAGRIDELDYAGQGGRTVGVVVVGRLVGTKGGYGHLNGYDYLFRVDCLERAEVLDRDGHIPEALTPEQRRKVEAFENSE
jgi:hypothetical protein